MAAKNAQDLVWCLALKKMIFVETNIVSTKEVINTLRLNMVIQKQAKYNSTHQGNH